jgi:pectin methylesterase-like acyl-CoA thioesterase/lysophospholipase L1-like esterase
MALVLLLVPLSAHAEKLLTVASDNSGDFKSVQEAIDAAPANSAERVVIHIKPGTYKERVHIAKDKPRITLRGDWAPKTVLTYDLAATKVIPPATQPVGTSNSYSTLVEADDFIAENLTFENSAGEVGQAVALRTTGERQAFYNCRMLGWQDTLYVHTGRAYFLRCYIEGRVDFIFGRATAVFEKCHIHSKNGGFVTAAATEANQPFGYVFLDCKLTGDGEKAFLGRPWRDNAAAAFIRCELGDHIRPEGWDNWRNPAREKTARFLEYHNTGPGADRARRVAWSRELSDAEAATYATKNVVGGTDQWDPTRIRIVLAGDSTVTDGAGWGAGFRKPLDDKIDLLNLSRGGRSSKSFRDEGVWQQVLDDKPDYILIQFGHNDQPGKGPERETDPKTTFRTNMARYVDEARAVGAKPILVTSLSRRRWAEDGAHIASNLTEYADATKAVAMEKSAPLIDLHARSIEKYEALGKAGCEAISPREKDGVGIDNTHLNAAGSDVFGRIVADELARVVPDLKPHIRQ